VSPDLPSSDHVLLRWTTYSCGTRLPILPDTTWIDSQWNPNARMSLLIPKLKSASKPTNLRCYITGCLTFLCASLIKYRALLCVREVLELIMAKGPVTDYSSTLVHWMRNRQPRYKGGYQGEMERPSPSYIVDVGLSPPTLQSPQPNFT
jgi:hypothetical protein